MCEPLHRDIAGIFARPPRDTAVVAEYRGRLVLRVLALEPEMAAQIEAALLGLGQD